ncbi:hypothetical protein B0H13DRAFT_2361915 [Mycena leptocephala]|nr:hypothetical protein B0H13DRAFT_2361915 [Mycena leptocephala]
MDVDPVNRRYILDAAYLATLNLEFLKSIIKKKNAVTRLRPDWNIKNSVAAARSKILADGVSLNWVVVKTPLGGVLHEDYTLDTEEPDQNLDELFRVAYAKGLIALQVQEQKIGGNYDSTPIDDKKAVGNMSDTPTATDGENEVVSNTGSAGTKTPASKQDDAKPMHKLLLVVSDERDKPVTMRAAFLFLYGIRKEGNRHLVDVQELTQELQSSTEAVVGSARLAEGADYLGLRPSQKSV